MTLTARSSISIRLNAGSRTATGARRRAGWITAAVIAGAVLIVGVFLFIQFREAVEDKGFWQNFNSAAVAAL